MCARGVRQQHEGEAAVRSPLLDERGAGDALGGDDVVVIGVVDCNFETVL